MFIGPHPEGEDGYRFSPDRPGQHGDGLRSRQKSHEPVVSRTAFAWPCVAFPSLSAPASMEAGSARGKNRTSLGSLRRFPFGSALANMEAGYARGKIRTSLGSLRRILLNLAPPVSMPTVAAFSDGSKWATKRWSGGPSGAAHAQSPRNPGQLAFWCIGAPLRAAKSRLSPVFAVPPRFLFRKVPDRSPGADRVPAGNPGQPAI